jgi:hypothetical protein
VTAAEAYELTTKGGASDFARVIELCQSFRPYCLTGGLAVNCYVEPVYTLDADIVVIAKNLQALVARLKEEGFTTEEQAHSVNATSADSDLRIQFTTDERYQGFLDSAKQADVLGSRVFFASLIDVVQDKLWAYGDPYRRLSKRKKDELDLVRLGEAYPELLSLYPPELAAGIRGGPLNG